MSLDRVKISYFSDVLCVWAYVAQVRLKELKQKFADKIEITPYHITLFGDTETRIAQGWKDKGGYLGFNEHVLSVCKPFPHLDINPDVWKTCQPTTSGTAHLFLKAIQCYEADKNIGIESTADKHALVRDIEWAIRIAFFRDARDISDSEVLYDIANQYSVQKSDISKYITNGRAMAQFCTEMAMKETHKLDGSPTYLFNNNRQKLYGNVGYKIMEANVSELLLSDNISHASWC